MAEIGVLTGLAQDFQSNERINDIYRQEEAGLRAMQMAQAKAKMYADDVKYQNAMNPFDNAIVKARNQKAVLELGVWKRNNPDWSYNPEKRAQYQNMIDDIKSNEDVLRGMATDKALAELDKDIQEVAKNPEMYDQEAYDNLLKQRENYRQFGHQLGYEAAQKEGLKAFVYQKPRNFIDLSKDGQELGNHFKANPSSMTIQYLNNGRDGAYQLVPKDDVLNALALDHYNKNKRQYDAQYAKKGVDPLAQAKKFILSGVETKIDIGQRNNLADQMALERYKRGLDAASSQPGVSPYQKAIFEPGYVNVSGDVLAQTFGSNVPYYYTDGEGKMVKTSGDVFHYEGSLYDNGYREKGGYKKDGVKIADGYILKPIEWGKEVGAVYDPFGFGDKAVASEWKDSVEIIDSPPDKEGKSVKLLKVKAKATLDGTNPAYQGRFDKQIMTNKQRDMSGIPGGLTPNQGSFKGIPYGTVVQGKNGKNYVSTPQGLQEQ